MLPVINQYLGMGLPAKRLLLYWPLSLRWYCISAETLYIYIAKLNLITSPKIDYNERFPSPAASNSRYRMTTTYTRVQVGLYIHRSTASQTETSSSSSSGSRRVKDWDEPTTTVDCRPVWPIISQCTHHFTWLSIKTFTSPSEHRCTCRLHNSPGDTYHQQTIC